MFQGVEILWALLHASHTSCASLIAHLSLAPAEHLQHALFHIRKCRILQSALLVLLLVSLCHSQVSYQGWRRFKLLTVDHDSKPYPMAAATWLDDESAHLSEEQQAATDELEQQVYGLLQQVASYMRQLQQSPGSAAVAAPAAGPAGLQGSSSSGSKAQRPLLPDSVLLFAPPPPSRQRSVADYLIKAGGHKGYGVCGVHRCTSQM
jgi:hypothetical protein